MEAYNTLSEAIVNLRAKGYTLDFNLQKNPSDDAESVAKEPALEFHVDLVYRFEGETDPSDNSILYAISTADGKRGILVEAYGTYFGTNDSELISKLQIDKTTQYN